MSPITPLGPLAVGPELKERMVEALHASECRTPGCLARGEQERAVEVLWPYLVQAVETAVGEQAAALNRQMWRRP